LRSAYAAICCHLFKPRNQTDDIFLAQISVINSSGLTPAYDLTAKLFCILIVAPEEHHPGPLNDLNANDQDGTKGTLLDLTGRYSKLL
jgi:hypothetical protein